MREFLYICISVCSEILNIKSTTTRVNFLNSTRLIFLYDLISHRKLYFLILYVRELSHASSFSSIGAMSFSPITNPYTDMRYFIWSRQRTFVARAKKFFILPRQPHILFAGDDNQRSRCNDNNTFFPLLKHRLFQVHYILFHRWSKPITQSREG